MIRKFDLLFSTLLIPLDYLMLVLAGIFVYYLRFNALVALRPVIYEIPLSRYFIAVLIITFLWLFIFALAGLYNLKEKRHFSKEFSQIFLACSVGTMLIILIIFFRGEYFSSRFIILAGWLMSIIFVSLGRILIHLLELFYYNQGKGLEPILIFGSGEMAKEFTNYIQDNPGVGYKVLGIAHSVDELIENWSSKAYQINSMIQAEPNLNRADVLKLIEFCNEHQIEFKYTPDIFGTLASNVKTETLGGMPIITISRTPLDGWGRVAKRLMDLIFSLGGLILLSPFFIIMAFIIKLDSPGPVFIGLERVGGRGKKIKIYKFRSMVKGAQQMKENLLNYNEREGPLFKIVNDPRVTRFGRFLRKSSLDELPQLFNVLIGGMSLVGPRPHEPQEVARYEKHHKRLLTIRPGITGLAQISGRSSLSFKEEAKLDIYYIENWSLSFDLQIILKTIPVVFSAKNVS